jgi:apolipoprotein N-acyltransferase
LPEERRLLHAAWFLSSGVLLYLATPPAGLGVAGFVALIPLVHAATRSSSYRQAALGGFFTGATFFLPALYWLTSVTILGWAALALYCGAYISLFAVLARAIGVRILPLAALWVAMEYVRGTIAFTGFPWLLLSHTQAGFTFFVQVLDVVGSYGLSGILVGLNMLLYRGWKNRRDLIVAAAIFTAICVYGYSRIHTLRIEPLFRVAMVQASVPQEMKEVLRGRYDPTGVLERYIAASQQIPEDPEIGLLIWPETVVLSPYLLNVNPAVLNERNGASAKLAQDALRDLGLKHGAHVLAGATSYLPAAHGYVADASLARAIPDGNWRKRYNSAYLLDPTGRYVDRYDKIHLVPFGEYIPLPDLLPFLASFVPFDASLSPGEKQTVFEMNWTQRAVKFGVVICYEDTDAELTRRLRRDGADFLINISNDAWFGLTELDQHFIAARYRAIENRVGVARSGNNGITGVIDPVGRVGPVLEKNAIGVAVDRLATTSSRTLYTRFGDWPAAGFAVATLLIAIVRRVMWGGHLSPP